MDGQNGDPMPTSNGADLAGALRSIEPVRALGDASDTLIVTLVRVDNLTIVWHTEPGARALLGIEPGEALGRSVWDFLSADVVSDFRRRSGRKSSHPLPRGHTHAARYAVRHRDGTVVEMASTAWRVNRSYYVSVAVPTRAPSVPDPR